MSKLKKYLGGLYYKLPYLLKSLITYFLMLNQQKKRYGSYYVKYLDRYRKNWFLSSEELYNYRSKQLAKLYSEAYYCTLFYRNSLKPHLSNELINSIKKNNYLANDVLLQFPLVNKSSLKNAGQDVWNNMRKLVYLNHTSGTSGTPTTIPYDDESFQIGFALWRRFHDNCGLPEKFKSVRISGKIVIHPNDTKPPFWVYNPLHQQLFMSSYHLTEKNMRAYVQKLNQFQPELIDAYPSAIYILANYINRHKLQLVFTPTAIATTAETLFDYQRDEIEKAFNCKVYNQYSSSEGGPFITECREGKLHLNIDSAVFEFYQNGKFYIEGEGIAELVVTSFRQWMFPLIRYQTGDWIKFDQNAFKDSNCACGCKMPYVLEILGREDDILFTKEKGWVGRLDPAYKGLSGIIQSSIEQTDLENIIVKIVPEQNYVAAIGQELITKLKERLGDSIQIHLELVDTIPQGPNGKIKAVKRSFTP
ncbi:MAG: hypothetical protein RL138_597 [Bacteroidota bacterium]